MSRSIRWSLLLASVLASLLFAACSGKEPLSPEILQAMEARAEAICACKDVEPQKGLDCVKAAEAEHPRPEDRPPKQDVTENSWKAYKGFEKAAHKCEMGVNSAYNAAKKR